MRRYISGRPAAEVRRGGGWRSPTRPRLLSVLSVIPYSFIPFHSSFLPALLAPLPLPPHCNGHHHKSYHCLLTLYPS